MAAKEGDRAVEAEIDVILGTAGWMDSISRDFNDDVQGLMRQVRNLMERWQGNAADTHSDAWTQWYNNANNLVGALEDDASALRAAAADYSGTDSHIAGNIGAAVNVTDRKPNP